MESYTYDIVVIGGGLSGISAAVAAARLGSKVALIGNRPVLGGNASTEVGININGAAYNALYSPSVYARETGIIEEIKQLIYQYDGYSTQKMAGVDAALFDIVEREKNIDLYLNTHAYKVDCQDEQIKSVTCLVIGSEREIQFFGDIFIDCTGDGVVGALAGAKFRVGSEGYDEYKESLAPEKPQPYVNGTTLMFNTIDTGKPEVFVRPEFAYDITKMPFFEDLGKKHRTFYKDRMGTYQGFWWVEYGGHLDTIKDNEAIVKELRKIVYGLWDYIKNSGKFEGVENLRLVRVGSVPGKRESRRFIGDYVLNQNDIIEKREFEDSAYIGGWPMDVHANFGIYDKDYATHWNFVPGMYNAPYRTLYSVNIRNLMFAGRNTSCTRVANGSTRVMGTCAAAGQAAGTAAHLCVKHQVKPRDITHKYIKELQKILLKNDQTLMGYREVYDITNAKAVSNSVKKYQNNDYAYTIPLQKARVIAFPVEERLDSVKIKVKNLADQEQTLTYKVLTGDLPECYMPVREEQVKSVKIEPGFDGLVKFEVNQKAGKDRKVYVVLEQNDNLALYFNKHEVTGVPSFTCYEKQPDARDPRRFVLTRTYDNIAFEEVLPECDIFNPQNVLSGYNRPYGLPNIWISEGKDNVQLEITLDEKFIDEIRLVFNTDLAEDIIYNRCPKLIKAYKLIVQGSDGAKEIEVNNNFHRVNVHKIGIKADKIILKPLENYGSKDYEVFGVKIY
ncbi:MAG TPA: FAD-dependent oxidoreductase [Clostridia bacterium]